MITTLHCRLDDVKFGLDVKHDGHPNAMSFTGILLITDRPSDLPPNGAEGHRIFVSSDIAKKRLNTLIGMGLNYNGASLSGHDVTKKIGTIMSAWIEGKAVKVKGVIWKKDFPETMRHIKGQQLGMSMELANVDIEDDKADVWHLKDFVFTGATVLWPEAAAYHLTALAASRDNTFALAAEALGIGGFVEKKKKVKTPEDNVRVLAAGIGTQVATSLKTPLEAMVNTMNEGFKMLNANITKLKAVNASADVETEDSAADKLLDLTASSEAEEEEVEIEAAADEEDSEDDDIEAAADTDSDNEDEEEADDDDVNAEIDDEIGNLGQGAKQKKGAKTSVTAGKEKAMKAGGNKIVRAMAAAGELITTLQAAAEKQNRTIAAQAAQLKKQSSQLRKIEAQLDLHAQRVNRTTLTPEASALLQKSGYALSDITASGRKFSIPEMDEILTKGAPGLGPTERMHFKNIFAQAGILDDGKIERGYGLN